jgi:hypothetical protein
MLGYSVFEGLRVQKFLDQSVRRVGSIQQNDKNNMVILPVILEKTKVIAKRNV